jgi:hypothetical protein
VLKSVHLLLSIGVLVTLGMAAQEAAPAPAQEPPNSNKTQVRINYLNVCNPSLSDQQLISLTLGNLPTKPQFSQDFEISRGRSSMEDAPVSNWVRLRRDFPASAAYTSSQYALTTDEKGTTETLVFHSRDTRDVVQVMLEDSISGASSPASIVATDTPVDRIRLERFGKASVVLAKCPAADQSAYQPLFDQASKAMSKYRAILGVKKTIPRELAALGVGATRPASEQNKSTATKKHN